MLIFYNETVHLTCKCNEIWCEGKTTEIKYGFLLFDLVKYFLLFMSSSIIFMTLVLTIKSGWLKYFMASNTIGYFAYFLVERRVLYYRRGSLGLHLVWLISFWGRKRSILSIILNQHRTWPRWLRWERVGRGWNWPTFNLWGWWAARSTFWWLKGCLLSLVLRGCQRRWTSKNSFVNFNLLEHPFLVLRLYLLFDHQGYIFRYSLLQELLVSWLHVEYIL